MTSPPTCPYCGKPASLVGGAAIYPMRRDLYGKDFWLCRPCSAYVGCHPGTTTALGRLANAELRQAKMAAHRAFDPTWKDGNMRRKQAYAWLAGELGIGVNACHVGEFDIDVCNRVVTICNKQPTARRGR
jgi:hypothetical protein